MPIYCRRGDIEHVGKNASLGPAFAGLGKLACTRQLFYRGTRRLRAMRQGTERESGRKIKSLTGNAGCVREFDFDRRGGTIHVVERKMRSVLVMFNIARRKGIEHAQGMFNVTESNGADV